VSPLELFTTLERRKTEIVEGVIERIKEGPAYKDPFGGSLQVLVDKFVEGFGDTLITGEADSIDEMLRALSRVVALRGIRFSDVFELPLIVEAVFRDQLVDELSDRDENERLEAFNKVINEIQSVARKIGCRFLDVFQENLNARIDSHNAYLSQTEKEFGIDLTTFRIAPEKG
jgi:hypothetical protein